MGKYFINTYGCQMNIHESEKLAGILTSFGYELADSENDADVIVFNTCCIRENAEKKAEGNIGALKKLKKLKKDLIIAVGGCLTQQNGYAETLKKMFPFIDIIFGTHNLELFDNLLKDRIEKNKKQIQILEKEGEIIENTPKTRTSYPNAWVNIMYGCNNFCTYCIVPFVRGRERSRKPEDIYNECKNLIEEGYKEITLLGQNVNSYGKDLGIDFPDLLDKIAKIPGKFRLRFMTNHPKDLSDKLTKVIKDNVNICHLIHLPVQAGSTRILSLMNRKYTREDYLNKIQKLKTEIPDIAITTDVMVGFPSETEQDFLDTYTLMEQVKYSGAFTFVYSKRKGTVAEKMEDQIPYEISQKRIMKLIDLQNSINREISLGYKGKTVEILVEDYDKKKKKLLGRDEYGRMAYFNGDKNLIGEFVKVKITKTGGVSLIGEIV